MLKISKLSKNDVHNFVESSAVKASLLQVKEGPFSRYFVDFLLTKIKYNSANHNRFFIQILYPLLLIYTLYVVFIFYNNPY